MENREPKNIIDFPVIDNYEMFEANREKADEQNLEHCPFCGKAIKNPKYFIRSIWGGSMYPANDLNEYNDSWIICVGSECRKKLPKDYVFQIS